MLPQPNGSECDPEQQGCWHQDEMDQGNRQGDEREGQAGTSDRAGARQTGPQAQGFDDHLGFGRRRAEARERDRERSGTHP